MDVQKVIAWVRESGPEYGADPAVLSWRAARRAPSWPR
jgi:hypothetical protein